VSRIGVTGHQGLKPVIEAFVGEKMRAILEGESHPVGITSLAAGADQLFARTVLALGGTIEVILPTLAGSRSKERLWPCRTGQPRLPSRSRCPGKL